MWADGLLAPPLTLAVGTMDAVLDAPAAILLFAGTTDAILSAPPATIPSMTIPVIAYLEAPVPVLTAALQDVWAIVITAPAPTTSAEIVRNEVELIAPVPTLDAGIPGGFQEQAPVPTLIAEVHLAEMILSAPPPIIFVGIDGGMALFAPVPQLFSVLFHPADVSTPENPYATPFPGWAINYETNAPSRYDALPANSFCIFNNKTYMACAAGIYEVGADNDAGRPIHASVTLGQSNFENTHDKRVPYVYVGARSTGAMQLKAIANNQSDRYYALNAIGGAVRGSRATLGKGLAGQYWQFRIDNVAGADFELDTIEFKPTILTRHGT